MRDRIVFPAVGGGWHDKHRAATLILDGRLCFQIAAINWIACVRTPPLLKHFERRGYTAISGKVVGKNVHGTIPKGIMGYDQYMFLTTVAVEPTFVAFL